MLCLQSALRAGSNTFFNICSFLFLMSKLRALGD